MAIEIKEIIVKTTVTEEITKHSLDAWDYRKLKREILSELKRDQSKNNRQRKDR